MTTVAERERRMETVRYVMLYYGTDSPTKVCEILRTKFKMGMKRMTARKYIDHITESGDQFFRSVAKSLYVADAHKEYEIVSKAIAIIQSKLDEADDPGAVRDLTAALRMMLERHDVVMEDKAILPQLMKRRLAKYGEGDISAAEKEIAALARGA